MINLTKSTEINFEEYEDNIKENGFIYIDAMILHNRLEENILEENSLYGLCCRIMNANSLCCYNNVDSRDGVYNFLTKYLGVSENLLFDKKTKSMYSISQPKLQKVYDCNLAREFLEPYFAYKTLKDENASARSIFNRLDIKDDISNNDTPLGRLYYNVNQNQNYRYNYKDYDVITINKKYNDMITVPKGYVLAWGDFSQSDLRIAYNLLLRTDENFKIVSQYDDMYMGIASLLAYESGEEFDKDKFLAERNLYKTYTLSGIYGKNEQMTSEGTKFMTKLRKFLNNCPKYQEYLNRINDNLELDRPLIIDSYFGLSQVMLPSHNQFSKPQDKALNTPIQSGTSLILIAVVNKLIRKFRELGYSKDDISVYMVRHDEVLFMMKEEVIKDSWILKNTDNIIVDDWLPLKMEFNFGYNYKVIDNILQSKYDRSCALNRNRMDKYSPSGVSSVNYYPIKPVYKIYVGMYSLETSNDIAVAFYIHEENKVCFLKFANNSELFDELQKRICLLEQQITDKGYDGIIVYNSHFNYTINYKQHLVKYKNKICPEMEIAEALAAWLKYSLDRRVDKNLRQPYICERMYDDIVKIEKVNLFENIEV